MGCSFRAVVQGWLGKKCLQQKLMVGFTWVGKFTGADLGWSCGKRSKTRSAILGFGGEPSMSPLFEQKKWQILFRFIPELFICVLLPALCPQMVRAGSLLVRMDKWAKRDPAHLRAKGFVPTTAKTGTSGLGSSTAHKSRLAHETRLKPNHKTILLLSDHIPSQKLCEGSTKSPVFSFTKFTQVVQNPQHYFCQPEFEIVLL